MDSQRLSARLSLSFKSTMLFCFSIASQQTMEDICAYVFLGMETEEGGWEQ